MSYFTVEGKPKLSGSIRVMGNKNEALPLVAAALLSKEPVCFANVPDIQDVRAMCLIASELGATVSDIVNNELTIQATHIVSSVLPVGLASEIRASILFASALLCRTGSAIIHQPGGDAIGRRRIDTHFHALCALGAELTISRSTSTQGTPVTSFSLAAPKGLVGTDIYLDEASVTATENALIAAAGAKGTTTIANAASEPHVQGLCHFLVSLGASIKGIGSNLLSVKGRNSFVAATHTIGSDYIEAGSFIGLAAATGSALTITDIDIPVMRMILFQFKRLGVEVETNHEQKTIFVPASQKLCIKKDFGNAMPRIDDAPWPGFPADLISIMVVVATQCQGTCLIHEKMFEARLFFVDKLLNMGAQIVLCDPHRVVVSGSTALGACTMASPDIRAGMALLIAALAADGTSIIQNIGQIDRGYHAIDSRLNALGAHIVRVNDRRRR